MCGVLGVYGALNLEIAQSLLQLLINRGQDASGLCWNNDYNVHETLKNKGPPSQIDIPDDIVQAIIGSTRYPTFGSRLGEASKSKFAQPFSYQTYFGTLSIVHNGNITNMSEISQNPSKYQSDCELITKRLGQYIDEYGNLEKGIKELGKIFDGAYSLVGILGSNLFTFRDPRGIRPLVYGYNGLNYVVSSESIVLNHLGIDKVMDVLPGQLILFDSSKVTIKQVLEPKNIANCYFEYVYFANSSSTMNSKNVYSVRLALGQEIGQQLLDSDLDNRIDFVVPVPDTSKSASQTISEKIKKPVREAIMKNRSSLRTFIMPTEDIRENAAKNKYLFVDDFIKDKHLLIVDDSIVRGLTMKYLIKLLRKKGAKEVHVAITCPPVRYACFYGVDFSTDTELIAQDNKPITQIKEEIGADSLTYLSLGNLRKAIDSNDLCEACVSGEYPTPYVQQIRLKIIKDD